MTLATERAQPSRATTAHLFRALSDETRLAVLELLRDGELCVCDLQAALDAAQSRLSFHLKVLKDAGLVRDRKEGRWSYYGINAERLAEAAAVIEELGTPTRWSRAVGLHELPRGGANERVGANSSSRAAGPRVGCYT